MKAYLIDPYSKSVKPVTYDGKVDSICELIGCDLFTTVQINRDRDTIFVDDEGLLKPFSFVDMFLHVDYPQPLVGKGLVLGTNAEGESVAPVVSLGELMLKVKFYPEFNPMDSSFTGGAA